MEGRNHGNMKPQLYGMQLSRQVRRLSIQTFRSTHLNLHLVVCLDWIEQLFQLHVIMKSFRRNAVDGISLHPTWVPSVSRVSAEDHIDFNLLLMTENWQFARGSYSYFLGDPIHFQVSAIIGNHMPLKVYVDHCVATANPHAETTLRHDFIENHGCLADAYLTNSNSRFLPRIEEHKLRFQLEAFRFYQEPSNQMAVS
ncbi:zona pellucida sperm-binding protein 3-like [Perca flavescens]|uniref:zona pellucida sperm-binding protein 3-like n=1 Tax=Perca flavescens TaxID=8167 RepID=UPI00106E1FA1|nr:zona pellucida sperm-binding protein 3-like [Perca flavescens]